MARSDLQEGPSVGVSGSAPDAYQREQASPAAFGAQVGAATQQVGQEIGHIGQVWGEIQTDDAVNHAMTEVNDHLNRYRALEGADALNARADTEKAIDSAFTDGRKGLKLPAQQLQYDQATRAYRERYVNGIIATHADQQGKAFAQRVNRSAFEIALTGAAGVGSDDDEHLRPWIDDAISSQVKQVMAEGNGSSREAIEDAQRRAKQAVYKTVVDSIGAKDPAKAYDIAERHKDDLGLVYHQMIGELRSRATTQKGLAMADQAFGAVGQKILNAEAPDASLAVRQAILEQESGNRSSAPTSAAGAVGPGQIMPETFKQFAKAGEDINNPADNRAVAARMIDKYTQDYKDPARVAVAYFSGPGNVAPADAPQPWLVDKVDKFTGKKVSDYVQNVTGRISQHGAMLAAKASVYDQALALTEGHPELRQVALQEIKRRYDAAATASLDDEKARTEQRNQSMNGWADKIWAGENGQPWHGDQSLTLQEKEHLDDLQTKTLKAAIDGKPGNYGPGYDSVLARIYSTAPGRILWPEQLLPLASGPDPALNPAGMKQALAELKQIHQASEGETQLMSNFWSAARHAVTLEYEGSNMVLPSGRDRWNKAMPVMTQALAQGKARGLTLEQMLAPEGKDSIWPALKPYLPSQAERQAAEAFKDDRAAAPLGEPEDWQKITDKAEAQRLFHDGRLTREHAMVLAQKNGWYKTAAPAIPTGGQ